MEPITLTPIQERNLYAAMNDLNHIDDEIIRAKESGIPIDPDLEESCKECRERLYHIRKNYIVTGKDGKKKNEQSISGSNARRIIERPNSNTIKP